MQRIKQDITSGQLKQIYLLYGEEPYLCRQYRDKLRSALSQEGDTMNTHLFEGKNINVGQMIDLAETLPFLASRRVIVVEKSGLFKAGGEKLAEYLSEPSESTFFIFVESEVDKRSKLFKMVQKQGCAVECSIQEEKNLKIWIGSILKKEGKQISENTASYLLEHTGRGMENIRTELEKLICYCLDREVVTAEDIDAICTVRISSRIFDMVSAIAEKRQKQALDLYYDLLALKEPPMRILFLIARQCNLLLQVKELKGKGLDQKSIGEKIRLPSFVAGKYINQASRFKLAELKFAVTKCVEAEEAVKTGRLNDMMSVELLILSVL